MDDEIEPWLFIDVYSIGLSGIHGVLGIFWPNYNISPT